jgi:ankyrin repeat protein
LDTTIPENQHQHVESIDATRPRDYTQEHLPQEPIGFIFSDNKIETHIPVEHVSPTVSKDQTRVEESIYSTGFDEQTRGHVSAEPANSSVFDTQRQVNIQVDSIDSTGSEQQVRGHLTPKSIDTAGPMENTQAGVSMETADAASSENQTETSLPIDSIDSTSTEERTQVNLAKESLDSTSPAEQIQLDLPLEFVDSASCEDHREMQTLEESTNSTGPDDEIRADLPMEPIDSAGPGEEKEVGLTVEYAHATDSEDQTQDDPSKVCIEPAYQEGQRQEELPEGSLNPAGSEGLTDVQPIVESVETAGSEDQIQPGAGPSEESIDSMSSQNQIHEDTPADQIDVHQQVENFDSADSGDQTQAFPHIDFTRSEGQREVERPVEFEDSAGSDFTVPNEYVHDDVRLYTPRSESERVICSILVAIQDADEELLRNIITGNQNTQIDINMAGISARPLLLSASTTQNHQLLTQLLTHRIQNQGDYNHTIWTPLICAIVKNQAGIVQHLLARQDIDVNRSNREQGTTPLLAAVLARNLEISRLLLERRDVDLNKTNEQGNSPLSTALCNYVSSEKTTELQTESAEILRMFLNRNDIDLNRHFKYPICSIVGDRSNAVDETALHFAILTQSEVAAQWLLERTDVDPNKGNSEGETPLSAAIRVAVENSDSQRNILRVLLKRQDLDINKSTNNEKFPPALHVAIRTGIIEIVEMLLSRGDVNVHVLDRENGIGATNFAEQLGNQDIIHLLRSRGG